MNSAVYRTGDMAVQHVRKWCHELVNGRISVLDAQKMDSPSTLASHTDDIEAMVKTNGHVLCSSQNSLTFHTTVWDIVLQCQIGHVSRVSFYCQGLDSLIYQYNKCLDKQGDCMEK